MPSVLLPNLHKLSAHRYSFNGIPTCENLGRSPPSLCSDRCPAHTDALLLVDRHCKAHLLLELLQQGVAGAIDIVAPLTWPAKPPRIYLCVCLRVSVSVCVSLFVCVCPSVCLGAAADAAAAAVCRTCVQCQKHCTMSFKFSKLL